MKMQNKWIIGLGIAMLIGLAAPQISSMEPEDKQKKELFQYVKALPKELQLKIQNMMIDDAIVFLGLQPIVFFGEQQAFRNINSVKIFGDIVIVCVGTTIEFWSLLNGVAGQLIQKVELSDEVVSIVMVDSLPLVITRSPDKTIKIWNYSVDKTKPLSEFRDEDVGWITNSIVVSGDKIVTLCDTVAKVWNWKEGELLYTLEHPHFISSVAVSDNNIVTGSQDEIRIWDMEGTLLRTLQGEENVGIESLAMKDKIVVSGLEDGNAKIWNIDGAFLHTLKGHSGSIDSLAIDNNMVVTGSSVDKTVKLWNLNGQLLRSFDKSIFADFFGIGPVALDLGNVVAGSNSGDYITVWPLSLNLQGTPKDNPLVWILQNANYEQADFIRRAYEATKEVDEFIIEFPSKDAEVLLSFPKLVQGYLIMRLKIRRPA